jgi:hypothetical protein
LGLIAVLVYLWSGNGGMLPSIRTPTVTQAEYENIREGMTYEEVRRLIGAPGEELSRSDIAG